MRVVLTILDAFPHSVIGSVTTPNLWRQAAEGAIASRGGESLMLSVTYSNHAAFVTGLAPTQTGHWGNWAWIDDQFVRTYDSGPQGRTIFDGCKDAGRRSVAVVGDHKLLGTMGALEADASWPPAGAPPEGTPLDPYGYPQDRAVIDAAARTDLNADFVLLHLNEPDTTMHMYGPQSDAAAAQYKRSDEAYGMLVDLLRPQWEDTVLITVSDHCQEPTDHPECVNLKAHAETVGWPVQVRNDGTGATVAALQAVPGEEFALIQSEIMRFDGIEGTVVAAPNVLLAWTEPHRMFGRGEPLTLGNHGSPRCTEQVAIVSGGHPSAQNIGAEITQHQPGTLYWAPTIRRLLDI
ncbi:MAG TPA: alkaline phosphatase family protein [Acidimicrobiales bacterium]|jgi:predicted AlkP superfamily pyrophosphatase or phosphodiesterase|nr:alkaline phosphatase family protein [Acidimicrobiales bacterium]|tara:strand:+ start:2002 stop:3051 length:1050 start_codon:yes stop_codon:yes gene_type:complete